MVNHLLINMVIRLVVIVLHDLGDAAMPDIVQGRYIYMHSIEHKKSVCLDLLLIR
jgi:hypothetical protein